MSTPSRRGEILRLDENCVMAVWGPVAIVVWAGECTLVEAQFTEVVGDKARLQSSGAFGLLAVVESTAEPPEQDIRRISLHINERLARRGAVGLATVVPGTGFRASVFRGVITGMSLMAGHSYPTKVFEASAGAAAWMRQRLGLAGGEAIDVRELTLYLEELRSTLTAHRRAVLGDGDEDCSRSGQRLRAGFRPAAETSISRK